MNFITYEQFIKDIKEFVKRLPKFEVVSFIPNSGMIPAFIYSKFHSSKLIPIEEVKKSPEKILIFDDSLLFGRTLKSYQDKIKSKNLYYAVVYTSDIKSIIQYKIDFYFNQIKGPRLFEWNWLQSKVVSEMAFDLDGVLCIKPTELENDDSFNYLNFIENTKTLYIPSHEIGAIITARLEKYRTQTEKWLNENNVKYKELVMLNSTAKERRDKNLHTIHKSIEYLKRTNLHLFIEDEEYQARVIKSKTNKYVLCIKN